MDCSSEMNGESSVGQSGLSASNSADSQAENMWTAFEQQEYETQFFGFTPKSFSDGLYNAVMEYMSDYLEPVIDRVNVECDLNLSKDKMREILSSIHCSIGPSVDKAFDKMEGYLMQNILNIPADILLDEDKIHDLQSKEIKEEEYSKEAVKRIENEIKDLHDKITAKKYVNECLKRELEESEPVLADLDSLLQNQKLAENSLNRTADFKDLLESTVTQLQELQQQLHDDETDVFVVKKQKIENEQEN